MKFCKDCWNFSRCNAEGRTVDFAVDDGVCCEFDEVKNMTNADRIRAMSDEELVKFMEELGAAGCPDPARSCRASCTDCMMEWLSSCIIAPKREHSRKPDEARNRIVELFGDVPRIELFARQSPNGWDCWGNETSKYSQEVG